MFSDGGWTPAPPTAGGSPEHGPLGTARPGGVITPSFLPGSGPELSCLSLGPRQNQLKK